MDNITVIILTKNEEKNIIDCLDHVRNANEILIIDDFSEDRTCELVRNLKWKNIKIFTNKLNNDYSAQRNYGLEKAKNNWVMYVDADERVSTELLSEIKVNVGKNEVITQSHLINGYYLKRIDYMWGRQLKYGEVGNIKLLRLAQKNAGKWSGKVHEIWKIKGQIGLLNSPLEHNPHPNIQEFLKEINKYSSIRADELFEKGVKTNIWQIILFPKVKFLTNYILKLGFLDGIPGFVIAVMMSFHSFLVRSKLWFKNVS